MNYKHLSHEERDRLAVLRSQGKTLREIAKILGRSIGTLSRELRRNLHKPRWGARVYYPHAAHKLAGQRLSLSHRSPRLKSLALRQEVWKLLEKRWSPELIAGRLRSVRPDLPSIGKEAIYQWIYQDRRDLIPYLARAHRQRRPRRFGRRKRIAIPGRISIHQRPLAIENRTEAGHWETDLIVGSGAMALQVLVERQSRFSRLRQIPLKSAGASRAALTRLMEQIPPLLRRSITYDNGPENVEHRVLNDDFDLQSYFCEPYHSWEKGTVENTNGLIRRFVPKGTPLNVYTSEQIQSLEDWLNDRPRKILQYQTPREVFKACCT
jgi:transposase, IS30 family